MPLGHYDNDSGTYQNALEVFNGLWLIHQETGDLYILGKEDAPSFDTFGADEDLIDELHASIKSRGLTDDQLQDDAILTPMGFETCWDTQRRFSPEDGYYYA